MKSKIPKPRNLVARALRDDHFRPKVAVSKKGTIPRKHKHKRDINGDKNGTS